MDISIIIPVYKVENYIRRCLDSVASQTYYGEVECILIDDCGEDKSWEVVNDFVLSYSGNIKFRMIRHDHNKGVSAARNTGLREAIGRYVFFLDSDDTITSDCLEKLSKPLKEYKYDFVFADNDYICDYPISIPFSMPLGPILDKMSIIRNYRDRWYAVVWNKLINLQFIKENHLFFEEGIIREDELWCFQLACLSNTMYSIQDVTYHYTYDNPSSIMSSRMSLKHFHDFTIVLEKEIETVITNKLSKNLYLYYQIEESKRWRMKDASRLLNEKDAYQYYKKIRQWHYINSLFLSFDFKYSLKNWIRDIHYLLPEYLGYKYILLINHLS